MINQFFYLLPLLFCLSSIAIVSGVQVSTDRKIYEVTEGRPLNVTVKVDNKSVRLPATLQLIHEASNHLVTVKTFEVRNPQTNVVIFANTSRHLAGSYLFAGFSKSKFEIKVIYLSAIHFHQLTTDGSHVTYVECTAGGFPKPSIKWIQNYNDSCFPENDVIIDDEVAKGTSSFNVSRRFRPMSGRGLAGRFTCLATNGDATRNRSLTVYDPVYELMLSPTLSLKAIKTGIHIIVSLPTNILPTPAVTYKVELRSSSDESCPNRERSFEFPHLQVTFDDLCPQTIYRLKMTSLLTNCSSINRTIYHDQFSIESVPTVQAGTVASIVLAAILTSILIAFVCWWLRGKSRKPREFAFMHNLSASTWSMAMDRTSSVIELPDSSGYLAASDITTPEHRQNSSTEISTALSNRASLRPPRISIESDYAVPYSPKHGNRMSAASLHESVSSNNRQGSVFLGDGSGYIAARQEIVPGDAGTMSSTPQRLSARRSGRPLSLDIELARGERHGYASVKKPGSADEPVYATIGSGSSVKSRVRPKSYI